MNPAVRFLGLYRKNLFAQCQPCQCGACAVNPLIPIHSDHSRSVFSVVRVVAD